MSATAPAIKSYFFGKGYRDLQGTIEASWKRNIDSARRFITRAEGIGGTDPGAMFVAGFWYTAAASVVCSGTVFFAITSGVHIALMFTVQAAVYLMFSAVYLTERAYLRMKGFFSVCPSCHSREPLPHYLCDRCGRVHPRLIPSSYGIFSHTCRCGNKLPATFFLNRGRLPSQCGDCRQLLDREHTETRKLHVAVVGGPSVGKSAFLFGAIRQLLDDHAPVMELEHEFVGDSSEADFERTRRQMINGHLPAKTLDILPQAFTLKVWLKEQDQRVIYLYDPAGEAYQENVDRLITHRFQGYLSGLILLIDPFAIPEVQQLYADRIGAVYDVLKPSALLAEDALDRLLLSLESHFELGKREESRVPLAVVINKVDVFDLEELLGEPAIAARIAASGGELGRAEAQNAVIIEQLSLWGMGALLQKIDARFQTTRFFSCSALGHLPDTAGLAFEPWRSVDPLIWLFQTADRKFGWE